MKWFSKLVVVKIPPRHKVVSHPLKLRLYLASVGPESSDGFRFLSSGS